MQSMLLLLVHMFVFHPRQTSIEFLPARRGKYICYGSVAAGCLSVTRRYCIKTAKPSLKLFRPSGSPVILVSSDTQFQGEPLQWGVTYMGVRKIGDFRRKSPFIS